MLEYITYLLVMCSNILVFLPASNVIANMHLSYCNRTSITLMDGTWSVIIMVVSHTTNQPVLCYPAALAGLPVIIPHDPECDTRQSQGTHRMSVVAVLKLSLCAKQSFSGGI